MTGVQTCALPISSGDCIGSITMVSKDANSLTEADEKILKIASNFLGKQVQ